MVIDLLKQCGGIVRIRHKQVHGDAFTGSLVVAHFREEGRVGELFDLNPSHGVDFLLVRLKAGCLSRRKKQRRRPGADIVNA